MFGQQLTPLGEVDVGHGMFAIAANGVVVDYLGAVLTVCYPSLDEMLRSVLLGLRNGTKLRGVGLAVQSAAYHPRDRSF